MQRNAWWGWASCMGWAAVAMLGCQAPPTAASTCSRDVDCASPLVCGFGHCRAQCTSSRDCPLGARCLASSPAAGSPGVCSLDDENHCDTHVCPSPLVCVMDQCRTVCAATGQCRSGLCDLTTTSCLEPLNGTDAGYAIDLGVALDGAPSDAQSVDAPSSDAQSMDAPNVDAADIDSGSDAAVVDAATADVGVDAFVAPDASSATCTAGAGVDAILLGMIGSSYVAGSRGLTLDVRSLGTQSAMNASSIAVAALPDGPGGEGQHYLGWTANGTAHVARYAAGTTTGATPITAFDAYTNVLSMDLGSDGAILHGVVNLNAASMSAPFVASMNADLMTTRELTGSAVGITTTYARVAIVGGTSPFGGGTYPVQYLLRPPNQLARIDAALTASSWASLAYPGTGIEAAGARGDLAIVYASGTNDLWSPVSAATTTVVPSWRPVTSLPGVATALDTGPGVHHMGAVPNGTNVELHDFRCAPTCIDGPTNTIPLTDAVRRVAITEVARGYVVAAVRGSGTLELYFVAIDPARTVTHVPGIHGTMADGTVPFATFSAGAGQGVGDLRIAATPTLNGVEVAIAGLVVDNPSQTIEPWLAVLSTCTP